jgi:hypothetical protein
MKSAIAISEPWGDHEKVVQFPDAVKSIELGIQVQNQAYLKAMADQVGFLLKEMKDLKSYVADLQSKQSDEEVMVDKARAMEILSISESCFDKYLYDVEFKIPCHPIDGKNLFLKEELIQWVMLYDSRKRGLS